IIAAAVLAFAVVVMWPVVRTGLAEGADALVPSLRRALEHPGLGSLLAPFRAAMAPLAAPTTAAWAAAMPPALAVLALHVAWVVARRGRFRQVAVQTPRSGSDRARYPVWSPTLTRLRPRGRAALALTWKNVAAVARQRRAAVIFAGAVAVALAAVLAGRTIA